MHPVNQIPIPELFVSPEAADRLRDEAVSLPGWVLNPAQLGDLTLLMNGGFFPLKGFMAQADAESVAQGMRLCSGAHWPVPVTLKVNEDFATRIAPGDDIALRDTCGTALAIMSVTDLWRESGGVHLGGKVKGLRVPGDAGDSPNSLRRSFAGRDMREVLVWHEGVPGDAVVVTVPAVGLAPGAETADLPADPLRRAMLQGLVARNFGATHIRADHPVLRAAFDSVGLVVIA